MSMSFIQTSLTFRLLSYYILIRYQRFYYFVDFCLEVIVTKKI